MEFIVSLALISIIASFFYFLWWEQSGTSNMPPHPTRYQLLRHFYGNMYDYKWITSIAKKHGGIYSIRLFGKHFVMLTDWKIMKEALVGQWDVYAGRAKMHVATEFGQDNDILFIDGQILKEKRRFTLSHLRRLGFGKTTMESVVSDQISRLFQILDKSIEQKVLMNDLFFMPVFNVLWSIMSAKQYDYDDVEMQKFSHTVKSTFHFFNECMPVNFYPFLTFVPRYAFAKKMFQKNIDEVKLYLNKEIDEHLTHEMDEPRDFFDVYLAEIAKQKSLNDQASSCFTRKHLVGTASDLFLAGTETTTSTLKWACMYMSLWPEIQRKIQIELDTVIGTNRLPTYSDSSLLPYLEATILEIHRYSSIVPMSAPHRTMSTTKLAGYTIPKDCIVVQNIWAVHNDKSLWGDPQVFRPERFINGEGKVEKPEYLIPFSIGARRCIGESLAKMEIFLVIACLLQRYSVSYATGERPPSLNTTNSITNPPETFHLVFKFRK